MFKMYFTSILILMIAVMEVVFAQNKQFCQSFADKNYTIDYGLSVYYGTDYTEVDRFLVIDGYYWSLEIDPFLTIRSSFGQKSEVLSKDYILSTNAKFSYGSNNETILMTGFLTVSIIEYQWICFE